MIESLLFIVQNEDHNFHNGPYSQVAVSFCQFQMPIENSNTQNSKCPTSAINCEPAKLSIPMQENTT